MIGTTRRRRTHRKANSRHERFLWHFELILEGARRAERPFSITQFTCGSVQEAEQLEKFCAGSTRACDAVGIERTNVLVVWDGTATAPASRAARRLLSKFANIAGTQCKVSTVGFPNAGYTPAALIRALIQAPSDTPIDDKPARDKATSTVRATSTNRRPMDRLAG